MVCYKVGNMKKIRILKIYKQILLECKRIQLLNKLSIEVENKFMLENNSKQKVLTLFR